MEASGGASAQWLVHSYARADEAMRLVREGKRSFYTQYLLNPSLEPDDVRFTFTMLGFLLLLRFAVSGAHHPRTRHTPSLFRLVFGRYSKPKRESKLCENLW